LSKLNRQASKKKQETAYKVFSAIDLLAWIVILWIVF